MAILRTAVCAVLILTSGAFAFAQSRQQRVKEARRALDALVKTQQPTGYWKAPKGSNRIRHTALAGYAMSAEGSSLLQGRFRRGFQKAVSYLVGISRRNGFIAYRRDTDPMVGHAVAMLFLADAIGDCDDPDRLRELHLVLHKAVRFLATSQLANGGWARDEKEKKPKSASARVTALQLQGMLACRRAGVTVPQKPIDNGLRFLLSRQQTDGGIPELPGKISPSDPVASAATLLCLLQVNEQRKPARPEGKAKQHRILILAGAPSRDYRLVTRMLHADPRFRVDAWLQMAVPKFIKNVVQPVDQLLTSFPKAEELAKYDAVITFDANWHELKKPDIAAFDAWIRKRGGGLVFRPGAVNGYYLAREDIKDIARLLPGKYSDYLDLDSGVKWHVPARLQWSNGKSAPVGLPIKILREHFRPHTRSHIKKARAGVKVLARIVDDGRQATDARILFSTHTAGKGRVFFCGTPETWRLRNTGDRHFERFWYGVLRYVVPSFSGELPKRRKPTPIDTKTAQGKAIARLQAYCDRVFSAKKLTKMEHRSVAEWNYIRAVSLQPNASRNKTVNAIRKRLLNSQQADGTWKPNPVDPLKQPANAAILLNEASIRR